VNICSMIGHLAEHRTRPVGHLREHRARLLGYMGEQRIGFFGRLLVDACIASAMRWRSASALVRIVSKLSAMARAPPVVESAVRRAISRAVRRALERLVEHAGKAREPLLEIAALAVEVGDQLLEGGAPLGDRAFGAPVAGSISATASASERP